MPSLFDKTIFNGEVFGQYVDRLENPVRNELIRSRAIVRRPEIASAMAAQTGGNFFTMPLKGLVKGTGAQNYDGQTNMSPSKTQTFSHSRVVIGRMKSWVEDDFSYDITGGYDPLENVAEQVGDFWEEIKQGLVTLILNGVFKMSDAEGVKFVQKHTYDVTGRNNSEGVTGFMDGTTLNTAMQRACGDNKGKFALAIMHSYVATNLENLRLLSYLKYTDKDGVQRDLAIGTLNGKTVLIDDTMPVEQTETTAEVKGVYTITISTAGASGDKINIGGTEYTFGTATSYENKTIKVGTSATTQATELKGLLNQQYDGIFTATSSSGVVTLTQVVGGVGAQPTCSGTGTISAAAATTTSGVARVVQTKYTTYVLGEGAIEETDCGAKVPYETDRDPKVNGGEDTLYSRQRLCYAPYGISFTKASMATDSPTDLELALGANWELVSNGSSTSKEYIDDKTIPIARIISLG